MDAKEFPKFAKAEAIKWLEEHITDDTRGVCIALDNNAQNWWTYSPHTFDNSALSNLHAVIGIVHARMTERLTEWLDNLKAHFLKKTD